MVEMKRHGLDPYKTMHCAPPEGEPDIALMISQREEFISKTLDDDPLQEGHDTIENLDYLVSWRKRTEEILAAVPASGTIDGLFDRDIYKGWSLWCYLDKLSGPAGIAVKVGAYQHEVEDSAAKGRRGATTLMAKDCYGTEQPVLANFERYSNARTGVIAFYLYDMGLLTLDPVEAFSDFDT